MGHRNRLKMGTATILRTEQTPESDHVDTRYGDFPSFIHSTGARVFLPPSEIVQSDEYAEGDLYGVEQNADSEFHRRRFDATLLLVKNALASHEGVMKILDVGCGEGHITARMRELFPGAEFSALDYSLSAIARANHLFPGIDFVVADACSPPYKADYFDAVVCNNLFEHVPDPLRLLTALRRVTKPGGHLIISTPSRYRFDNLLRVIFGRPVRFMSAQHVTEYSVGQVFELLRFGGFTPVKTDDPPIRLAAAGVKELVAYRILFPCVKLMLRAIHSHHSLAHTVFFSARKN
jgi:SAM-dependent methyltransferase